MKLGKFDENLSINIKIEVPIRVMSSVCIVKYHIKKLI